MLDRIEALLDERIAEGKPLILSNDPAAWKFLWANFKEQAERFAFYPSELELFGEAARKEYGAEKVFAFTPIGSAAVEAEENDYVDIAVNPRELYRIMVRTGSEPNPRRTAAVERYPMPAVSGKYGQLLQKLERNMDADFEPLTVEADGRTLRCALCRNLGQARKAVTVGGFDVIRVVS